MGGGLMQLVAYGAQDIYLTGNPQITFFKVVYRRHTNFSVESIEQTFNGTADFGKKVTVTVSRNGDLISSAYLQATLPQLEDGQKWRTEVGHRLIKSVEVEIGGQRIDKHYSEWLSIWSDLSGSSDQATGYDNMIGDVSSLNDPDAGVVPARTVYVPLQFWFNRNPGLALPLIALQYHEVKFNIEINAATACTDVVGVSLGETSLYVDYIYLDTDERRRFAQTSHEYLIEQLQYTGSESISGSNHKVKLNFNHPVKELVWVVQAADDDLAYTAITSAKLQLNGHDRFSERAGEYFNWVQPYQHHTSSPREGINVYSFALKPEEHQPSGTANMSRIDNATLSLTTGTGDHTIKVFAVNYNVLRIMSGMGGLAYSN
tara:strand:+ start:51 stop:1172 length:1122 start_codon:yes stop_codon:yes gene_type:complete